MPSLRPITAHFKFASRRDLDSETRHLSSTIKLIVKLSSDKSIKHTFSRGDVSLPAQIAEMCQEKGLPFDEDSKFQLLLKTQPKWAQKFVLTEEDLFQFNDGDEVRMVQGTDFVHTILEKMQDLFIKIRDPASDSLASQNEFVGWMDALLRNSNVTIFLYLKIKYAICSCSTICYILSIQ